MYYIQKYDRRYQTPRKTFLKTIFKKSHLLLEFQKIDVLDQFSCHNAPDTSTWSLFDHLELLFATFWHLWGLLGCSWASLGSPSAASSLVFCASSGQNRAEIRTILQKACRNTKTSSEIFKKSEIAVISWPLWSAGH